MIPKDKKRIQITLTIEQIAKLKDLKEDKRTYFFQKTLSEIVGEMIDIEYEGKWE